MLIILTHIFTEYMRHLDTTHSVELKLIYYLQHIVIFGTPSFIILSQLLTTLNYDTVNLKYLWERVKYILLPYFIVGLFYCFSESRLTATPFKHQLYENLILGRWHGYFIIVIMQFFILSYIIFKISPKIFDSKIMLIATFIIQFSFLHQLDTNEAFSSQFLAIYPLSENTFILGWIFFFFFSAYIGRNYTAVINFLTHYVFIVIILAILSFGVFVLFQHHDYGWVTSFNENLMCYHASMFLLLLSLCLHFKQLMMGTINLVSAFSFFIYLFHPIILSTLYEYFKSFSDLTFVFIAISLLYTLGICVGVGLFLREFYIFRFAIGKQPYKLNIQLS
ncbi:polysaccharide intercellular adhesin biosynthesis/export protein IcaC [Staphylococcus intermedius]|uniref:polysaccharide intercellular adhesin biosynthesis/export protein IcaC n=1 Tax=Staphylococcus intermedius TaxID=1285 RepID=UPI000BBC64E4|nr:polysaccharide intercellular adhesin biosynthesis/export protein IcaC [Staphylococcus intermedius]PCF85018.1 poly-beta-1,6-N-acetyl-D-glucosamine export protein [Staphylococcus intermedius]